MSVFDFHPEERTALEEAGRANAIGIDQLHPGFWDNSGKAIDMQLLRGGARAAHSLGLAGSVPMVLYERATGQEGKYTDERYAALDSTVQNAVDYWTPDAATTGTAGRVLGELAEIVLPLMAGGGNPSLLIASQELGTAADLARAGADPAAAVGVGVAQGLATAVGFKIPFLGASLLSRMGSGAAGNLVTNVAATEASKLILDAAGNPEQAKQFDVFDLEARAVDVLTGLAFGAMAHAGSAGMKPRAPAPTPVAGVRTEPHIGGTGEPAAPPAAPAREFTRTEEDAILAAAQAKHFQLDTAPGRPADTASSVAHQEALGQAVKAVLEGEPVVPPHAVEEATFVPEPAQERARQQIGRAVQDFMRVYHGTPHTFTQFDLAKVGTGEGAQAYGHGLYFAENKDVAGEYARRLTSGGNPFSTDPETTPLSHARGRLTYWKGDKAAAARNLRDAAESLGHPDDAALAASYREAANLVESGKAAGNIYSVDLSTEHVEKMLDWDAPLTEQSESVKAALQPLLSVDRATVRKIAAREGADNPFHPVSVSTLAAIERGDIKTGADLVEAIGNNPEGSAYLHALGIPGIKYFDGGSRGKGGTRNIVVFDDKIVGKPVVAGTEPAIQPLESAAMPGQSGEMVPAIKAQPPSSMEVAAAQHAVEAADFQVPTGEFNADGDPIVRSARELLAEADEAITKATKDAKGFDAAASCYLARGAE